MSDDDKRKFQRMLINCGINYTFKGQTETHTGAAVNISANGIMFECDQSLSPGAILKIMVPSDMPTSIMRAEIKVVRVEPSDSGSGYQVAGEILYKMK